MRPRFSGVSTLVVTLVVALVVVTLVVALVVSTLVGVQRRYGLVAAHLRHLRACGVKARRAVWIDHD